ncbi:MAG TPA: NADH-ubiquinone oxidoreductase-F iron-sulfur binding region domain-containing protein [Candidatus Limnocylindria bacterium]|nr:NADH-ubiquinone oxidoreductase-F iron-sulfur binding region domain-containing protein [Candidatus Limnocylindria bacterium]
MQILPKAKDVPAILLGRVEAYDPDGPLAGAEQAGAWSAWKRTATSLSPQAVIRLVSEAGLRGRGGAGYPTGAKWRACAAERSDARYVVANGFEADPGAQLDRTLMERDPHAVLEGVALAAYAVGATRAFVCVRATFSLALRRLQAAARQAEEAGYLGADALGTGFDLHVEALPVPGGFVVGEETVLLRAIENKRAQPEQRPPHPSRRGLWGRPTVVNNVETLAAVPWIAAHGAQAFRAVGDEANPGTTLVQISGAVRQPGIAEVPTGIPLRRLIDRLAGGPRAGSQLKAVLVGGPAGGFLPLGELASTPLAPEALEARGAIWGSGTLVVADEAACLVDMATLLERYLSDESCGKTIPCRIGVRRLYEIGQRATRGLARPTDPQLLEDLSADVRDGALCGLEYCAPNPMLSVMRYFREEFDEHFLRGSCPAGVCTPLRLQSHATQGLSA